MERCPEWNVWYWLTKYEWHICYDGNFPCTLWQWITYCLCCANRRFIPEQLDVIGSITSKLRCAIDISFLKKYFLTFSGSLASCSGSSRQNSSVCSAKRLAVVITAAIADRHFPSNYFCFTIPPRKTAKVIPCSCCSIRHSIVPHWSTQKCTWQQSLHSRLNVMQSFEWRQKFM